MAMGRDWDILATGGDDQGNTHALEDPDADVPIFEEHNQLLHGKVTSRKIVSRLFMKKYIQLARARTPVLTRESCDIISTEYAKLRAQEMAGSGRAKTQPVTARTLETLIRLSTAHAKARLSRKIQKVSRNSVWA
jgi:DNA replication licensing factor MCM3